MIGYGKVKLEKLELYQDIQLGMTIVYQIIQLGLLKGKYSNIHNKNQIY